jgi:beta-N-acetylhexosaminidase
VGAGHGLAVGFDGLAIPDDVRELAARDGLGGIILFRRNCPDIETILALTGAARSLGPDLLVLVDHEGGRVHRLPAPFTRFPPAADVGAARDPALAGPVGRELRAAGFDSGLAPVVDCATDPRSAAIGDRAFARAAGEVAACGAAFVEAQLAEGLIPAAKHFPGHGRTEVDSHLTLPEVTASRRALQRTELRPFRQALRAGCPAVLVAHVRYPALDPVLPASLSPAVIGGLLREELGFDGLVVSDDLEMQAVADTWGIAAAALRFLQAGGDLALVCRQAEGRRATADLLRREVAEGRLDLRRARERRGALRRAVDATPRPDLAVVGCAEHRELAEAIGRLARERRGTV